MEMARFSNPRDAGYIAISGQLWLWANSLPSQCVPPAQTDNQAGGRRLDNQADSQPGAQADSRLDGQTYGQVDGQEQANAESQSIAGVRHFGTVNSGGGQVIQGDINAGGSINISNGRP